MDPHFDKFRWYGHLLGSQHSLLAGRSTAFSLTAFKTKNGAFRVFIKVRKHKMHNYLRGFVYTKKGVCGVVSGVSGCTGTVYKLQCGSKNGLKCEITLEDAFGIKAQGYGTHSVYPQWLTPSQMIGVAVKYHSLEEFVNSNQSQITALAEQGHHYYSHPLLIVRDYKITHCGKTITKGNKGYMWLDITGKSSSINTKLSDAIVSSALQTTFAIQFPDETATIGPTPIINPNCSRSLYVSVIKSVSGTLHVATLFHKGKNALSTDALYRWAVGDIEVITHQKCYEIVLKSQHLSTTIYVNPLNEDCNGRISSGVANAKFTESGKHSFLRGYAFITKGSI